MKKLVVCFLLVCILCANAAAGFAAEKVVITDDFEDGNYDGWTENNLGYWTIKDDGSKVLNQGDVQAREPKLVIGEDTWTDYSISAKVKTDAVRDDKKAATGLYVRFKDENNFYNIQFYHAQDIIKIQKKVEGTYTTLVEAPFTFEMGKWYEFKAVANGNKFEMYIDNKKMLEVVDNELSFKEGKVGLDGHRSVTSFDDVKVTLLNVPEEPKAPAANAGGSTSEANPKTGDAGLMLFAIPAVLAAAVVPFTRKKK